MSAKLSAQKSMKRTVFSTVGLTLLVYVYWASTENSEGQTEVIFQGCSHSGFARKLDRYTGG